MEADGAVWIQYNTQPSQPTMTPRPHPRNQLSITDRSKAVVLLWLLEVACRYVGLSVVWSNLVTRIAFRILLSVLFCFL